jgi:hypothetical protein
MTLKKRIQCLEDMVRRLGHDCSTCRGVRNTMVIVAVEQLPDGTYHAEHPAPCPACGAVPKVLEIFEATIEAVAREPTTVSAGAASRSRDPDA